MAIQFARTRFISRSTAGNAVRSAAYNLRADLSDQRTGQRFYFKHREAPLHHEVLLPEGADERFRDPAFLWNAVEKAENRKNSQVALEMILALPANLDISDDDRNELARTFVQEHFVFKGLATQIDVHAPHDGDLDSETANWHAHVLITTRRIEGARLAARKARDLNPEVRRFGGKSFVMGAHGFGEAWRDHQNAFFREHGYQVRVDPTVPHSTEHLGPVRMRRRESELNDRAAEADAANYAAARDPVQVMNVLTRNNSTFSEWDLDRYLAKHVKTAKERNSVKVAVLLHRDVFSLHDRVDGEAIERFTTRKVREEERATLDLGAAVAAQGENGVAPEIARATLLGTSMRDDQRAAFEHTVAEGGLKIVEGRAGTGKSYTLSAIRTAHARDNYRVVGLAPTNAVALDLKASGFTEARTIHSALFGLKNGRDNWDKKTVIIVDEAAMVDTPMLSELLLEARKAGAKVVLAGDDRQLASIERGGMFSELRKEHGSVEITEVTRQKDPEQRQAARDLAEGRFQRAVETFDRIGAITWTIDQEAARAELIGAWAADVAADAEASRFVFAYTNDDVDALNADLRSVRRGRGELGEDVIIPTRRGMTAFAVGDRVQFTETDKTIGVSNGNVGRITRINRITQRATVELDGGGGQLGKTVSWAGANFSGVRHGYAGTIYKGQGKTLDHTYLYHTKHWRNSASYVALTRQRESAKIFVAQETARDVAQLARQMARSENKAASMAYATADEIKLERAAKQAAFDAQQIDVEEPASPSGASWKDDIAATQRGAGQPPSRPTYVPETLLPPVEPDLRDDRAEDDARRIAAAQEAREWKQSRIKRGWYYEAEMPRDPQELKDSLNEFDNDELRAIIGISYSPANPRERITLNEIGCEVDEEYQRAFGYAERLREKKVALAAEMEQLGRTIAHAEGAIAFLNENDGLMRRVMRGMNLMENREVSSYSRKIAEAADRLGEVQTGLDGLIPELADAERAEARSYDLIDGDLRGELAERNRLSKAASEVIVERSLTREGEDRLRYQRDCGRERGRGQERDNEIER